MVTPDQQPPIIKAILAGKRELREPDDQATSGKELQGDPSALTGGELTALGDLTGSLIKNLQVRYLSDLQTMDFSSALSFVQEDATAEDVTILISGSVDIDDFRMMSTAPFEISLFRLRGTGQWVMKKGTDHNTSHLLGEKSDDRVMVDVAIHNHPKYAVPMPSFGDVFQGFYFAGTSTWIIGEDGMLYVNTDQVRHSEDEEKNLSFRMLPLEMQIPEGGFERDERTYLFTEKTREQLNGIYEGLNISQEFVRFEDLTMTDITRNSRTLVDVLQSQIRKERSLALNQFLAVAGKGEALPFLKMFSRDESPSIQEAAMGYLDRNLAQDVTGAAGSLREFTDSQLLEMQTRAFRVLFAQGVSDRSLIERFQTLAGQHSFSALLSSLNPNWSHNLGRYEELSQTLVETLVTNLGAQILDELREGGLDVEKVSATAAAVLLRLGEGPLLEETLVRFQNDKEDVAKMYESIAATDKGIALLSDYLDKNDVNLDWDTQFEIVVAIAKWHDPQEFSDSVRRVIQRIPFQYFHRTFSNVEVPRVQDKLRLIVDLLPEMSDDPRAIVMREIYQATGMGISLTEIRNRYLADTRVTSISEDSDEPPSGSTRTPDPSALMQTPGGIDLNPNNLDLQTQGEVAEFNLPFDPQMLENIQIDGLFPVIINITPITNLPLLLGVSEKEEEQQLSSLL